MRDNLAISIHYKHSAVYAVSEVIDFTPIVFHAPSFHPNSRHLLLSVSSFIAYLFSFCTSPLNEPTIAVGSYKHLALVDENIPASARSQFDPELYLRM